MADPTQIDIQKLTTAIQDLTKKVASFGSSSTKASSGAKQSAKPGNTNPSPPPRTKSKSNDTYEDDKLYRKLQRRDYLLLRKDASKFGNELGKLSGAIDANIDEFAKTTKTLQMTTRALSEMDILPNNLQDKLVETISSSMKSSGVAKAFEGSDIASRMREIDKLNGDITDTMLSISGIVKNSGAKSISGMSADDMLKANEVLQKKGFRTVDVFDKVSEAFNAAGVKSTQEFNSLNNIQLKVLAENLTKAGVAIDDVTKDLQVKGKSAQEREVGRQSAMAKISSAITANGPKLVQTVQSVGSLGQAINTQIASTQIASKVQNLATNSLTRLAGVTEFSLMAAITGFAKGVSGLFRQFMSIANVGLAGSFNEVYLSALKMGTNFETMSEIYLQARREITQFGSTNTTKALQDVQDNLRTFGMDMESSAKASIYLMQSARDAGAIMGSPEFAKTVNFQTEMWKKMNVVTGISAEEFAKLNAELLNSADTQQYLLSFSRQERQNKVSEMMITRQWVTQMTANAQQAQQVFAALQGLQQSKASERFDAAAKFQQLAGVVGKAEEGAEAFQIMMKRNASPEEQKRLAEINASVANASESMKNMGFGSELVVDSLQDGLPGAAKSLMDAGTKLQLAADAQRGITDKQVNSEVGRVQGTVADSSMLGIVQRIDGIKNTLSGPILMTLGSIALGVGVIAANSGAFSGLLGKLGGMGGIGGKLSGAAGVAGSALGKLAKGGAGGLALMGAQAIVPKESMAGSILNSNAANGAAMGALVGSFVPVLGTLLGAGAGGLIGGAMDAYQYASRPKINIPGVGTTTSTTSGVVNNTVTSPLPENQSDDVVKNLQLILAQLQRMTGLDEEQLKVLTTAKDNAATSVGRPSGNPFAPTVPSKDSFLRTA